MPLFLPMSYQVRNGPPILGGFNFTIEFYLEDARTNDTQKIAEALLDLLIKIRQILNDLQTRPMAS